MARALELGAFGALIAAQFGCALYTIANRASIYPDPPRERCDLGGNRTFTRRS
jgi:hypothetical protein